MKHPLSTFITSFTLLAAAAALAQVVLPPVTGLYEPGNTKPILVSVSGLTGEAATTLRFDLYVQGFAFTNAESAQYLITGSNDGNLYAFAVGCGSGGATCDPLWVGAAPDNSAMYSSPAVTGGVVYIGSSDGTLYAFAVGGCPATATGGVTPAGTTGLCTPVWVGHTGGDVSSSPAVSGGVV